ncbi:PREDICTED: fibroblast growth factor receptor 2-like isoform X5 [Acropora digitifera]|uniref:fibroblast growth factor receptor 2-like isoform X5 n=1 Tax=Acropora digitifera TaxID=70779 RepID=UPI00077AE964|nr:PREDICTED: fibroblast growth factor receptor 2-like isoform X5 [Acropora digitifera]
MAEADYKNMRLATFALIFHGTLLLADGGSITWYEPPPFETVTNDIVTFTSFQNLTEGSVNRELSFNFSLTADLTIVAVTIELDGDAAATYVPSARTPSIELAFVGRFNVTWVPNKLTLIVLNVISADKGRYRCEVLTSGGGLERWKRIIEVDVFEVPKIIEVSGFTVREGGNMTLKCLAEGKPRPSITWTRLYDGSNITWSRLPDGRVISRTLVNITRQNASVGYRCTATNGAGNPDIRDVFIDVQYKPDHVSLNVSTNKVCAGTEVLFTCSAGAANPAILNYSLHDKNSAGAVKTSSNQGGVFALTVSMKGQHIYTCEAANSVGTTVSSSSTVEVQVPASVAIENDTIVVLEGENVTLRCFFSGFPSPNVSWINNSLSYIVDAERILELSDISRFSDAVYTCSARNTCGNDSKKVDIDVQYHVEATGGGENATVPEGRAKRFSCPVAGNPTPNIKWFKGSELSGAPISNEKELEATENGCYTCLASNSLGTSVSITQCLTIVYKSSSTVPSTTVSEEFKCNCPDNETTLLVIIGVLVIIIVVLMAVIIWQQKKLRGMANKRPYEVPEEKDAGFYDNKVAMKDVNPTHLRPKNSAQQQNPDELAYMPLRGISPTGEGPITPEIPAPNVEYAPLDMRTRSWEVARDDVKVEKIIGKGAFGQVAKGTAKNLRLKSGATSVAIKMVKANAPESDKRDLKSELELMKRFKPHPHVIKLLGCVTESEPLLVLIEYVPYGDLLGYLRKSRGLNDTYYKDPDIKPKTSLTSQQLMKFAWQIADGMSYLSLKKVIHRDLAARNVLVGEKETCKITDFGMTRDVQEENIYERKTKGRLPVKWTAYESLLYGQYTTKSDVWSYGVVLYEISTIGGSPYPRIEGRKIVSLLQQGYRMPKPEHVDNDLYQIMMNCWQSEPEARPSFNHLTQQLKRMENQHKKLIKMHIYDNRLYANLEDLNA